MSDSVTYTGWEMLNRPDGVNATFPNPLAETRRKIEEDGAKKGASKGKSKGKSSGAAGSSGPALPTVDAPEIPKIEKEGV